MAQALAEFGRGGKAHADGILQNKEHVHAHGVDKDKEHHCREGGGPQTEGDNADSTENLG